MNSVESLREILAHSVHEIKRSGYWDYDIWKLYSQPRILQLLVSLFYSRLQTEKIEFDVIAGLGTSGTPLASFLSYNIFKEFNVEKTWYLVSPPVVGLASRWMEKIKPAIPKGSRVLLVDSEVKSGNTSWDGFLKICGKKEERERLPEEERTKIAAFFMMCDYVKFLDRDLFAMFKEGSGATIIKLFDFTPQDKRHEEDVDFQTRLSWFTPRV